MQKLDQFIEETTQSFLFNRCPQVGTEEERKLEKDILGSETYTITEEKLCEFLRSSLQKLTDEMLDEVRKMKPDERKVATFGDWQAETYEEKMLVRAVLDTIIDKWK